MHNILIYSDPHIGVSRGAHTTPLTSARLQAVCATRTLQLLHNYKVQRRFCLGDLFDCYGNPEQTIMQAVPIVEATDLILAGNHDLINRESEIGSLQLLKDFYPEKILISAWGQADHFYFDEARTRFCFVPHLSSQELFEQALDEVIRSVRTDYWNILCLHCNYNRGEQNLPDSVLNLDPKRAEWLSNHFDVVLLGHEHSPTTHLKGKVTVVGNIHPTGFGDISPKRALIYDAETGKFKNIPISSQEELYLQLRASELPADPARIQVSFLDVFDDLEPGKANKQITQIFAKAPNICGVRLSGEEQDLQAQAVDRQALENLPDFIARDLEKKDAGLHQLWTELSAGATQ